MKAFLITTLSVVSACAVFGAKDNDYAEMGGLLVRPNNSFVAVIDCNSGFKTEQISKFFFPSGCCMKIPYRVFNDSKSFEVTKAESRLQELKANSAIYIGSNPELPFSLTAVESKWAFINFGKLIADNPSEEVISRRMDKMISRATMALLGGGSFMDFKYSATKRVNTLEDLDRLAGASPSPIAMASIGRYMRELGIREISMATYEQACSEGWAPAPTNAVQKEIWDEVHAIPKNPMTIKFDQKKGR